MALKPFNSIGGFSVGEVPSNVILANGDITTTNITTTGISNLNSVGNVRISGGSNGQVITTNGSGVLSFSTIDTAVISNGTSNVSVALNGNVTAAVAGNTIFTVTTAGANLVGNLTAGGVKTDNLYYANGNPWDLQQPAGANNEIQFNSNGSFGASANFAFDDANTTLTVAGTTANILVGNSAFGTTILSDSISVGNLDPFSDDYAFIRKDVFSLQGNASTGNAYVFMDIDSGVGYSTDNIYTRLSSLGFYMDNTEAGSNATAQITQDGAISATNSNDTYFSADGNSLQWFTVDNAGFLANANVATHTSKFQAPQLVSNVATGTAPFIVTSTTQVANLNVATAGTAGSATTAGTVTTAAQPNITSVGNLTGLTVGNATSNVVIADTGTITATGNITAPYFIGNVQGNISGNIVVPGSNGEVIFNNAGNAGASNAFSFNTSSNVLTVSGNVSATNFIGNGAALTEITGANVTGQVGNALVAGTVYTNAQPNITSVGTLSSLAVTGNASAGNLIATGDVSGATLTGTLTTAAQPNVTSLGTLSSLDVTGNITTSANLVTDLIVGKTTSISISATGANSNVFLKPTGTGTVDVWGARISNVATPTQSTDAATKGYVDATVEGLHIHASVEAATDATLATESSGTITYNNGTAGVGATLTTTGTYTTIDGVTLTNGMRILVKDEANAAHNGIYVRTSTTVLTRATDFDTAAEIQGGDFTFVTGGTLYNSTGWVQIDDVVTVGTDPVEWVQFSGAGTYLAGTGLTLTGDTFSITNTAVTSGSYGDGDSVASFTVNAQGQLTAAANVAITANAANLTGTTLSSTVLNSSLTSVGTLGSLAVTGNVSSGNANLGNLATANFFAGTLTTAAQPNITSVGTLGSLSVTGNVSAGNVSGTTGAFTNVSGNGSALTAITGANVTGQVGNALVAGTVYTNAQPNITSVGTLTSLAVTGNVTTGNVSGTTGAFTTANVSGNVIVGGTTVSAGTVTTTATTANATIASFPVSGTTGIEFLVKGTDATGGKYSVAKVVAVTDGSTTVDYTVFATVNIGTSTGSGLQVVLDGTDVKLQVTPSSSNSTVWTTQYNLV